MGPNPSSLAVAVVLGGLAFLAIAVSRAIAVPSRAVDSMKLGSIAGITPLASKQRRILRSTPAEPLIAASDRRAATRRY